MHIFKSLSCPPITINQLVVFTWMHNFHWVQLNSVNELNCKTECLVLVLHPRLYPHSTESKTAERPLKDHETCLIFQWSFNELSMISEVFHDSWLIFQWSSCSPWSPKLFETVQNSLSAVFQENGLSVVFQQSFSDLSMNFQRSY